MNYEKKLALAKEALDSGSYDKETIEYIFPELKKSDDERIRKALIDGFTVMKDSKNCGKTFSNHNIPVVDILAWLEKQGEQKPKNRYTFNSIPRLLDMIEPTDRAKSYCQKLIDSLLQEGYATDAKIVSNYLKQMNGEKVAMATMDEQKPADNVEPKFHIGDCVVDNCGYVWKIEGILNQFYILEGIEGGESRPTIEWVNKTFHLWTIADAKEGDVLFSLDSSQPFIYKERKPHEQATAYCGINIYGKFFVWNTEDCIITLDRYIPATKEQRDLLFTKMKDAGYEWDWLNKELKKIEQNSFESDSVEKAMCKAGYEWSEETHQLKKIEQEQTIDYPENLPKDNWELVHEFVEKFGRIPKDEDELNALVEYILKRQKSAWSEEDEKMLNEIVGIITGYNAYTGTISVAYDKHIRQIDWLKLIKDRIQPQNCIYYNPYKEVVESIAEMCKHYDKASHSGLRDFYDNVNVKCKDAKEYDSLFPQNTWKPSDEQIQALDNARHSNSFDVRILDTLFHDLKKLREE